jgi:DNA-binding transcriptional ArsR family regulator
MNDPLRSEQCARKLAALGTPERLRIVGLLCGGAMNVGELAAALATNHVNLAHHLGVLRQAGLVERTRRGRFIYYALAGGVRGAVDPESKTHSLDLGCCRLEFPAG